MAAAAMAEPRKGRFEPHGFTEEEARVRAIVEIVNSMVDLSWKGQNVDLNALKSSACRKYGLSHAPKLVEMIAARTPFSPSSEPNPSERPPVSLSSPSCPSPTTAPTSPLPVTFVSTAPVDPIRILSTALSLTLVTSQLACEQFEQGITLMCKQEAGWISLRLCLDWWD